MKVSEILKTVGDADIPDSVLIGLGLIERDHLIGPDEVSSLTGIRDGYTVIRKLKAKYRLSYDEARIPLSIVKKHYHLN